MFISVASRTHLVSTQQVHEYFVWHRVTLSLVIGEWGSGVFGGTILCGESRSDGRSDERRMREHANKNYNSPFPTSHFRSDIFIH